MKTTNTKIKKSMTALAVLAALTFSAVTNANEMTLPIIKKPAILEEGTQTNLSAAQIAELLPWAKDSKIFLSDLLDNIQGLSTADKIDRLADGIATVVGESAPKNSELMMRYALNRGLVLNELLTKEMNADAVGTQDAKLRVLKSSIQIALKYYETDMAILAKKSVAPFVIFGLDYFEFLSELNKSIFDASAQYAVQRTALEWLQWDLYRDLNNASYAPQIVKINNGLKTFPSKKLTDAQSIAMIRQMKALAGQLKVVDTLKKLQQEKEMAAAKTEAEKQAIINKRLDEERRIKEEQDRLARQKALEALNNGKPIKTSVLMPGDLVLHGNTLRNVEYVTDNSQVILKAVTYTYNQTVANQSDVEKCDSSNLGLNASDTVIFNNTIRNVQCIGEKGRIVLKAVTYTYNQDFSTVDKTAKTVGTHGRFSVGDKVLYKNNVRTIQYLDEKGTAVLLAVTYTYNQDFTNVTELSKVY